MIKHGKIPHYPHNSGVIATIESEGNQ